jgi:hypothetical protein
VENSQLDTLISEIKAIALRLAIRKDGEYNDLVQFVKYFVRILKVFEQRSAEYGPSWRDEDSLGPKGMFTEIRAKYRRMRKLLWDTPDLELRKEKIVEVSQDSILYHFFTIYLIGPIDEDALQKEIDRT